MSCQEFITNLNGLRDGGNFPKELLKVQHRGRSLCGAWSLSPCPKGSTELKPDSAKISWRGQGLIPEGTWSVGPAAAAASPWPWLVCANSQAPPTLDLLNWNPWV